MRTDFQVTVKDGVHSTTYKRKKVTGRSPKALDEALDKLDAPRPRRFLYKKWPLDD